MCPLPRSHHSARLRHGPAALRSLVGQREGRDRGVVGFKAFLCDSGLPEFPRADDLTLFEGLREAARLGLPVAVHAESQEITQGLLQKIAPQDRGSVQAFLASRPVIAELEAIQRATLLAREAGAMG